MNEYLPIIFSGPMVRALLADKKTQTRRLAWRKTAIPRGLECAHRSTDCPKCHRKPSPWQRIKPGTVLYVRENFAYVGGGDPGILLYSATWKEDAHHAGCDQPLPATPPKWTPSIHMPKAISRIRLRVMAKKIEPLQAISEDDARAEGCPGKLGPNPDFPDEYDPSPREEFRDLWKSLHGADSWAENPEVVAMTFHREQCNVTGI